MLIKLSNEESSLLLAMGFCECCTECIRYTISRHVQETELTLNRDFQEYSGLVFNVCLGLSICIF